MRSTGVLSRSGQTHHQPSRGGADLAIVIGSGMLSLDLLR
jgi:hypothetical protein